MFSLSFRVHGSADCPAGRDWFAAMDGLTIIILCSALAGNIAGSLGLSLYSDVLDVGLHAVSVEVLQELLQSWKVH